MHDTSPHGIYQAGVRILGCYKTVQKTTTVKMLNDRINIPTAHSGTFACLNARLIALQAKEPEFCQRAN